MRPVEPDNSIRAGAMDIKELMLQHVQQEAQKEQAEQPEEDSAAPEEEQPEVEAEDTTDTSEEAEETDDESEEGPDVFEITANGQTHELEWEEIQRLAAAGFDYTKKTQELSEKVKTEAEKLAKEQTAGIDKHREDLVEKINLVESLYSNPLATNEQLNKLLAEGDTEEYLRLKGQEDSRKELLQQVKVERDNAVKQQQEEQAKFFEVEARKQTAILLDNVLLVERAAASIP